MFAQRYLFYSAIQTANCETLDPADDTTNYSAVHPTELLAHNAALVASLLVSHYPAFWTAFDATERFSHDHLAVVLGAHAAGGAQVVRLQFTALSPAERDRLVSVVFAVQRDELRRQRDAARQR